MARSAQTRPRHYSVRHAKRRVEFRCVFPVSVGKGDGMCIESAFPPFRDRVARSGKRFVLVKEKDNDHTKFDMEHWELGLDSEETCRLAMACSTMYAEIGLKGYRRPVKLVTRRAEKDGSAADSTKTAEAPVTTQSRQA